MTNALLINKEISIIVRLRKLHEGFSCINDYQTSTFSLYRTKSLLALQEMVMSRVYKSTNKIQNVADDQLGGRKIRACRFVSGNSIAKLSSKWKSGLNFCQSMMLR